MVKDLSLPAGEQYTVRVGWQNTTTGAVYTCTVAYPYYWSFRLASRISAVVMLKTIAADFPEFEENHYEEISRAAEWLNKKIPRGEM